jgi:hypothetical protein
VRNHEFQSAEILPIPPATSILAPDFLATFLPHLTLRDAITARDVPANPVRRVEHARVLKNGAATIGVFAAQSADRDGGDWRTPTPRITVDTRGAARFLRTRAPVQCGLMCG